MISFSCSKSVRRWCGEPAGSVPAAWALSARPPAPVCAGVTGEGGGGGTGAAGECALQRWRAGRAAAARPHLGTEREV